MKKQYKITLSVLAAAAVVAGCATAPESVDLDQLTAKIVKASFRDQGIVKASVLETDETNKLCSAADVAGKPLDEKTAKAIEASNLKSVKWPSNGKFLGDWKEGEKIAQSGRGLTWTDAADTPNGGNCYNATRSPRKKFPLAPSGQASTTSARFEALSIRTAPKQSRWWNTPGARSGTPRPITPAPTCRALAIWVY
jgi:sulfur-oxidizing protein SoxX